MIAATLAVSLRPADVVMGTALPRRSAWSSANSFVTMAPEAPSRGITASEPCSYRCLTLSAKFGAIASTLTVFPNTLASSWRTAETCRTPGTRATAVPTAAGTVSKPLFEVTT